MEIYKLLTEQEKLSLCFFIFASRNIFVGTWEFPESCFVFLPKNNGCHHHTYIRFFMDIENRLEIS